MTGRESFYEAIRSNPSDNTGRLVFADFIEDYPQFKYDTWQAELMRLQCQPTGSAESRKREEELIEKLRPYLCPVCPECNARLVLVSYSQGERIEEECTVCSASGFIGVVDRGFCSMVTVPAMRNILFFDSVYQFWQPTKWAEELIARCPVLQQVRCSGAMRIHGTEVWAYDLPGPIWARLPSANILGGVQYPTRVTASHDEVGAAILSTLRDSINAQKKRN
jgi:uncharacterized protein (TIGR02996 family)